MVAITKKKMIFSWTVTYYCIAGNSQKKLLQVNKK